MLTAFLFAAAVTTTADDAYESKKRIRCVREQVIGSLIGTRRVCHTQEEWSRIRRDANDEARRVFLQGQGRPTGQ